MKYCDDTRCPNFQGDNVDGEDCKLGFNIQFRTPKTIADAIYHNWGYVMSKACRKHYDKTGKPQSDKP